jgi:hypothetical protein
MGGYSIEENRFALDVVGNHCRKLPKRKIVDAHVYVQRTPAIRSHSRNLQSVDHLQQTFKPPPPLENRAVDLDTATVVWLDDPSRIVVNMVPPLESYISLRRATNYITDVIGPYWNLSA